MLKGCYTALITPLTDHTVDWEGLGKLVDFQIAGGITGILAVGTTGESPTLNWQEHNEVTEFIAKRCQGKCQCIAGTGSNNTQETLESTEHAAHAGVDAALLVDPYYNGPSSLEIRREYVAPVARRYPRIEMIPYVIPGRSGTQLLPEDLALLHREFPNVGTVKEATGDLDNMRRTRTCCGDDFSIMSGDDDMTFTMMTDPGIRAAGVISVATNIAPAAIGKMVQLLLQGDVEAAEKQLEAVKPLFGIVTVKTREDTPYGEVTCRARNPLAVKTLMAILGMPGGPCRPPLGKMSRRGFEFVRNVGRTVWRNNPEVLQPVVDTFGVDLDARLNDDALMADLAYESYS